MKRSEYHKIIGCLVANGKLNLADKMVKSARGDGIGRGGPRQGDGGSSQCVCPTCGYTEVHRKGIPCSKRTCPTCNIPLQGV